MLRENSDNHINTRNDLFDCFEKVIMEEYLQDEKTLSISRFFVMNKISRIVYNDETYWVTKNGLDYKKTVAIESGFLNLRAVPSTNADIITQMPKGAFVVEFGTNGEWSYVSYTVNGEDYVGYASSQFLH